MSTAELAGTTAVVTGASRGFGRGIATALVAAGAQVVGVARDAVPLKELESQLGKGFIPVAGDATDPGLATELIGRYRPRTLVLGAGAIPMMGPVHTHTWETFSRNWEVDARQAFEWTVAALRAPLAPGSVVVAISSGAAVRGSAASGGYAGAKATVRFISAYAAEESERASLDIRFVALLPQLTPTTELGRAGVAGYAMRRGADPEQAIAEFGPALTPEQVGAAVLDVAGPNGPGGAHLVTPEGIRPI